MDGVTVINHPLVQHKLTKMLLTKKLLLPVKV